jgi:hypothetical protein
MGMKQWWNDDQKGKVEKVDVRSASEALRLE